MLHKPVDWSDENSCGIRQKNLCVKTRISDDTTADDEKSTF